MRFTTVPYSRGVFSSIISFTFGSSCRQAMLAIPAFAFVVFVTVQLLRTEALPLDGVFDGGETLQASILPPLLSNRLMTAEACTVFANNLLEMDPQKSLLNRSALSSCAFHARLKANKHDAALFALVHFMDAEGIAFESLGAKPQVISIFSPVGWLYSGPLQYGKTEFDGNPLFGHGILPEDSGLVSLLRSALTMANSKVHANRFGSKVLDLITEIMPKGRVTSWKPLKSTVVTSKSKRRIRSSRDRINVELSQHHQEIQSLIQPLGTLAVMEFVGYAATEFLVLAPSRFLIRCSGTHSVFYSQNGISYPVAADLYNRHGDFTFSVDTPGLVTLFVRLRGTVESRISFELQSLPRSTFSWAVTSPLALPDIVSIGLLGLPNHPHRFPGFLP